MGKFPLPPRNHKKQQRTVLPRRMKKKHKLVHLFTFHRKQRLALFDIIGQARVLASRMFFSAQRRAASRMALDGGNTLDIDGRRGCGPHFG